MRILRVLIALCAAMCPLAGAVRGQVVRCSSDNGHRQFCQADTRYGVTMVKQERLGRQCQQDVRGIITITGSGSTMAAGRSLLLAAPTLQAAAGRFPALLTTDTGATCAANTRSGVALENKPAAPRDSRYIRGDTTRAESGWTTDAGLTSGWNMRARGESRRRIDCALLVGRWRRGTTARRTRAGT